MAEVGEYLNGLEMTSRFCKVSQFFKIHDGSSLNLPITLTKSHFPFISLTPQYNPFFPTNFRFRYTPVQVFSFFAALREKRNERLIASNVILE